MTLEQASLEGEGLRPGPGEADKPHLSVTESTVSFLTKVPRSCSLDSPLQGSFCFCKVFLQSLYIYSCVYFVFLNYNHICSYLPPIIL